MLNVECSPLNRRSQVAIRHSTLGSAPEKLVRPPLRLKGGHLLLGRVPLVAVERSARLRQVERAARRVRAQPSPARPSRVQASRAQATGQREPRRAEHLGERRLHIPHRRIRRHLPAGHHRKHRVRLHRPRHREDHRRHREDHRPQSREPAEAGSIASLCLLPHHRARARRREGE